MYTQEINGIGITIKESASLFSPLHADRGTLAMLSVVNPQAGIDRDEVLEYNMKVKESQKPVGRFDI